MEKVMPSISSAEPMGTTEINTFTAWECECEDDECEVCEECVVSLYCELQNHEGSPSMIHAAVDYRQ
jgi:hypothetical protein